MVHSEKDVLDWLLAHCQHDRVLYNALTNHSDPPTIVWLSADGRWLVCAVARRSRRAITVYVVPDFVTGEPHHYYRRREYRDV